MSEATVSDEQLRLFIERIERMEEEKKGVADDIRDMIRSLVGRIRHAYQVLDRWGYRRKIARGHGIGALLHLGCVLRSWGVFRVVFELAPRKRGKAHG